jgi:hypothetical protein
MATTSEKYRAILRLELADLQEDIEGLIAEAITGYVERKLTKVERYVETVE